MLSDVSTGFSILASKSKFSAPIGNFLYPGGLWILAPSTGSVHRPGKEAERTYEGISSGNAALICRILDEW